MNPNFNFTSASPLSHQMFKKFPPDAHFGDLVARDFSDSDGDLFLPSAPNPGHFVILVL